MDYTFAPYKSPALESTTFDLIVKRLIQIGYPETFKKFTYNPIFRKFKDRLRLMSFYF